MADKALVSSSPLSRLLAARRIRTVSADVGAKPPVACHPPCELVSQGEADLAVVIAPNRRAALPLVARARAFAATAVVHYTEHAVTAAAAPQPMVGLEMGPDGGLWTPHFSVGLAATYATSPTPTDLTPCDGPDLLIIGPQRLWVEALLSASLCRGVRVRAAIALGSSSGTPTWRAVLPAAECLEPAPMVALVLAQSTDPRVLASAASESSLRVVVLPATPTSSARGRLVGPPQLPAPLSPGTLAPALGWTAVPSPEIAAEVAWLRCAGVSPRTGRVATASEDADHQHLLRQVIAQAGLAEPASDTIGPPPDGTDDVDAIVTCGQVAANGPEGPPRLRIDVGDASGTAVATHARLTALAALLRTAPPLASDCPHPSPAATRAARKAATLLAHWPTTLQEDRCKQLLQLFGLRTPGESLVTSATAAASAAATRGLPVAVKAIGPGLLQRSRWGGVVLPVVSVAGVRQAFRDVVAAAQARRPDGPARCVAITEFVPLLVTLDIGLFRLRGTALMQVQARQASTRLGRPLLLRCPLTRQGSAHAAEQLLRAVEPALSRPPKPRLRSETARFLQRLSDAGAALAPHIQSMRLDTVALCEDGAAPLIVDARGEQQRR